MTEQLYNEIGGALAQELGISKGQMFGKPCMKSANNKAFVAFFKDAMVFKLGRQEIQLLRDKYPGSENWDPSGKNRAMKDWLQIPQEFHEDWSSLARQSHAHVMSIK